jgi:hypothetical protein
MTDDRGDAVVEQARAMLAGDPRFKVTAEMVAGLVWRIDQLAARLTQHERRATSTGRSDLDRIAVALDVTDEALNDLLDVLLAAPPSVLPDDQASVVANAAELRRAVRLAREHLAAHR